MIESLLDIGRLVAHFRFLHTGLKSVLKQRVIFSKQEEERKVVQKNKSP
jgi:hypothetical protein